MDCVFWSVNRPGILARLPGCQSFSIAFLISSNKHYFHFETFCIKLKQLILDILYGDTDFAMATTMCTQGRQQDVGKHENDTLCDKVNKLCLLHVGQPHTALNFDHTVNIYFCRLWVTSHCLLLADLSILTCADKINTDFSMHPILKKGSTGKTPGWYNKMQI